MEPNGSLALQRPFVRYSRLTAGLAVAAGILVLCGWIFDITALRTFVPGLPGIPANAALAFILSGMALWLLNERHSGLITLGRIAAAAAAIIGALTLGEYVFGWNLGIDQLLFADRTGDSPYPGRIPLPGAINFLLFGTALLVLDLRVGDRRPAQWLLLAVGAVALMVIIGYAYDVASLYRPALTPPVPLHGMILFVLLAIGGLCARPQQGLTALIAADDTSALLTRRLLPAAILIPPAIGWLRLQGEQAGLYETNFGIALFAMTNVVIFTLLIWMTAARIRRADDERRRAESAIHESQELLHAITDNTEAVIYVKDLQGRYLMVNRRYSELFHISNDAIAGKTDHDLFPREQADAFRAVDVRVVAAGRALTEEEVAYLEDGPHTYVSVKCPLRDASGRIHGVFGISTDITDRKRTEQALRDSEDRTRSIIDTALDAVITMNEAGVVTGWNAQAESTFGWTVDEAIGRVMAETIIRTAFERPTRLAFGAILPPGNTWCCARAWSSVHCIATAGSFPWRSRLPRSGRARAKASARLSAISPDASLPRAGCRLNWTVSTCSIRSPGRSANDTTSKAFIRSRSGRWRNGCRQTSAASACMTLRTTC